MTFGYSPVFRHCRPWFLIYLIQIEAIQSRYFSPSNFDKIELTFPLPINRLEYYSLTAALIE